MTAMITTAPTTLPELAAAIAAYTEAAAAHRAARPECPDLFSPVEPTDEQLDAHEAWMAEGMHLYAVRCALLDAYERLSPAAGVDL